jgi:hypothetical protein
VSPTAEVCEAFAREGWCEAPAGTCPKLHVWECQEWREKGTCSRGAKCGLQHVLRAKSAGGVQAKKEGLRMEQVTSEVEVDTTGSARIPEEGEGIGFDDGASWIGVPSLAGDWDMEQGVPAPAEDDEEDGSNGDQESDDDHEDEDGGETSEDDSEQDEFLPMSTEMPERSIQEEIEGQEPSDRKQYTHLSRLDRIDSRAQPLYPFDVLDGTETNTEDEEEEVLGVVL